MEDKTFHPTKNWIWENITFERYIDTTENLCGTGAETNDLRRDLRADRLKQ